MEVVSWNGQFWLIFKMNFYATKSSTSLEFRSNI